MTMVMTAPLKNENMEDRGDKEDLVSAQTTVRNINHLLAQWMGSPQDQDTRDNDNDDDDDSSYRGKAMKVLLQWNHSLRTHVDYLEHYGVRTFNTMGVSEETAEEEKRPLHSEQNMEKEEEEEDHHVHVQDLQRVVLQILDRERNRDNHHNHSNNTLTNTLQIMPEANKSVALIELGVAVLKYCVLLKLQYDHAISLSSSLSSSSFSSTRNQSIAGTIMDSLCEIMTQFSKHELIQESSSICLLAQWQELEQQVQVQEKAMGDDDDNNDVKAELAPVASMSHTMANVQRILFPILQAMNWHHQNVIIVNCGMALLSHVIQAKEKNAAAVMEVREGNSAAKVATEVITQNVMETVSEVWELKTKAMTIIEYTGGMDIFFNAFKGGGVVPQPESNSRIKNNRASNEDPHRIDTLLESMHRQQLEINICNALSKLAMNHPENQLVIVQQAAFSKLLDTLRFHSSMGIGLVDPTTTTNNNNMAASISPLAIPTQPSSSIQVYILDLLASLAKNDGVPGGGGETKKGKVLLLEKGAMDGILTCLKDNYNHPDIQATACRAIANLFDTTDQHQHENHYENPIKRGSSCIKPILRVLRLHAAGSTPPNFNGHSDVGVGWKHPESPSAGDPTSQILFYGCTTLRRMSHWHREAIVKADGITTLLHLASHCVENPDVQYQVWRTMNQLLRKTDQELFHPTSPTGLSRSMSANSNPLFSLENFFDVDKDDEDTILIFVSEGGLVLLLQVLAKHPGQLEVQHQGLACLACMAHVTGSESLLHHVEQRHEVLVANKGLDIVLWALFQHGTTADNNNNMTASNHAETSSQHYLHNNDDQAQVPLVEDGHVQLEIAKHGVDILYCLACSGRQDFQMTIAAKNGIHVLLIMLQEHLYQTPIQMCACQILLRILVDNHEHLESVLLPSLNVSFGSYNNIDIITKNNGHGLSDDLPEEGDCDILIRTLLKSRWTHRYNAILNAHVVEILSHLAQIPTQQSVLFSLGAMDAVVDAMKLHALSLEQIEVPGEPPLEPETLDADLDATTPQPTPPPQVDSITNEEIATGTQSPDVLSSIRDHGCVCLYHAVLSTATTLSSSSLSKSEISESMVAWIEQHEVVSMLYTLDRQHFPGVFSTKSQLTKEAKQKNRQLLQHLKKHVVVQT